MTKAMKAWEYRKKHGKKKLFSSPEELVDRCCEYFIHAEKNALKEVRFFTVDKRLVRRSVPKMRAMTVQGLCLHLNIGKTTWNDYKNHETHKEYNEICVWAEAVMSDQKISGAAAGLLNPVIIARLEGLKESSSHELTGKDGGAIETRDAGSIADLSKRIAFILTRGVEEVEQLNDQDPELDPA